MFLASAATVREHFEASASLKPLKELLSLELLTRMRR